MKPPRVLTGRLLRILVLFLVASCSLAADHTLRAQDPTLAALSTKLKEILEDGQLPELGLAPATKAALLDPQYGCQADYQAWIRNVRDYSHKLESFHEYRDLPIVTELTGDPINVPWRLDAWAKQLLDGKPGIDTALREAAFLMKEMPSAPAAASQTLPPETAALLHKARTPLDRLLASVTLAAKIVDKEALGSVPPKERELLRFVIPWICRSGGRFSPKSKGAPGYGMEMGFEPNEPLTNSAPLELRSVTGLTRYLHALAGETITNNTPFLDETGEHPQFNCHVDFTAMQRAFAVLQHALSARELAALQVDLAQHERQADLPQAVVPGVTGKLIGVVDTAYGPIIIGGAGPNRYEDVDALAILDLGGDDDYVWNHPEEQIGKRSTQVIVDFAGDDVYETHGVGGPGAGLLGISILIDRAGNDRYCQGLSPLFHPREQTRATLVQADPEGVKTSLVPFPILYGNAQQPDEKGVNLDAGFAFGAGFLGIGVLVDEAGDDLYLGQKFAFGCGSWRGVGVLHDASGNDVYAAGLAAIGAGINGAFGLLDDRAGDDHYQCLGTFESTYSVGREWDNGYTGSGIGFGSSWRAEMREDKPKRKPTLGGGLGLVHDAAGDDSYIGSSFGVAAGYAGGIGAIIDDAGNDTYFVKRGPDGANHSSWSGNHALGNGCHRGVGYLLDRAGNDRYSASNLGGGTAWDIASGFLLDLGGDDLMTDLHGKHFAGNTGSGAAKGFAVSFHRGGTDVYERATFGNASVIGEGYPGVGGNFSFFFKVGPEFDKYPTGYTNNTVRLSAVSWKKEPDGKEYPQGIGLFLDGPDILSPKRRQTQP